MRARSVVWILGALALAWGCTVQPRTDLDNASSSDPPRQPAHRQIVQPEGLARLPVFSTAVRTGDLLFLSGQIGTLQGTAAPTLVEGGVGPETRQTMDNILTVLQAVGLSRDDLVKCTVFLADIEEYAAMNEVYLGFFPEDPPARSAMAGSGLALGARVEIECIAAFPIGR